MPGPGAWAGASGPTKGWWAGLNARELAGARQLAGAGQERPWLEDSLLRDAEGQGWTSEEPGCCQGPGVSPCVRKSLGACVLIKVRVHIT